MISGVKRKNLAIESTYRFFQTVDLIISHFKRDADKKKIFELIDDKSTFKDLLISTAAIHIYHNIGIRVEEDLDFNKDTIESTKELEKKQKEIIFGEVKKLLGDSFELEIDMLYRLLTLEEKFLNFLIEERDVNFRKLDKERKLEEIEDYIEKELLSIILKNHPFYFYDIVGDLIGYSDKIKIKILEEGSALKDLSVELEKKLKREDKEDKFIEISSLKKTIEKIKEDFEFKSYKELQVQQMPVRMLKRKILEYNLNLYPTSISGLKAFLKANKIKKLLVEKIESALKQSIDYEDFEDKILDFLKNEVITQLKTNPNDFIYFLEDLNENKFSEVIYNLRNYGIYNILDIINIDESLTEKVNKNMIRYNIDKYDVMRLNDPDKNVLNIVKKAVNKLDISVINQIKEASRLKEFDLVKLINQENNGDLILWEKIEEITGFDKSEIKTFLLKKQIIDKIFIEKLDIKDYSQILILLEFNTILDRIVKDIFFYILSKILRQLSRIIESYSKVVNEKTLFLLALKKIIGTKKSEEWVRVKIEELLIQRMINLQEEIVVIFDAFKDPFLVNGFLLGRLTDISLNKAIYDLENQISPIFEGIVPLRLKTDIISPVSYCLSYDLIKRFQQYEKERKEKVKEVIKQKQKEEEEKKREVKKRQQETTFNWVERRITSSFMRIKSSGINPNQLFWQEKDTNKIKENLKIHSEAGSNPISQFEEFFHFTIQKIKSFDSDLKLPTKDKIQSFIKNIIEKIMIKRLSHEPNMEEIKNMLEGERLEVATQIAKKIGKIFDKALYTKFKKKKQG
jgi:hypothetical protein